MNIEVELRAALVRADGYPPSADLFARVTGSVEEDAKHRARVRRTVVGVGVGCLALVAWFASAGSVVDGRVLIPGWALEAAATAVMAALVVVLGPALRRFGLPYLEAALGRDSHVRFAALLDVAYYLVCAGYVLLTVDLAEDIVTHPVAAENLLRTSWRIGGLALLMGIGHTVTILSVPLVGLFLRSIRWRSTGHTVPDPRARAADRVAVVALGILAGGGALLAALLTVLLVVGGIEPG